MKLGVIRKLSILVILIGVASCDSKNGESEGALPPLETPPSYLSFRVNFPISELEKGLNRVLPNTLIDDALPMKDQEDTLYLTVERKGSMSMSYQNSEMFASIPLKIRAAVKKSVLGLTFSNKDTPVEFSGVLEASAKIDITDEWGLSIACLFRNFDLGDQATFSVMGMTFNAEKTINSALESHRDQLSNIICNAINQSVDLQQVMEGLWLDIQNPISIAQNPRPLWLYSDPIALNGELIPTEGVLSIHMEYRTNIQIRTDKSQAKPKPLQKRSKPLNRQNKLVTYPDVRITYADLSTILTETFDGQSFKYEGYEVKVNEVKVGHIGQKLALNLKVSGDINGSVKVSGKPILSADRQLSLSEFKFEIDSDDDLLNMADWAVHSFAEDYLSEQVKVDTQPFFDGLDDMIRSGISREISANKINVDFNIQDISTYQTRMTDSYIQWIFSVEGDAGLTLKNGLFKADK